MRLVARLGRGARIIVTDNATCTDTVRPTTGFDHVLLHGEPAISDGGLVPDALPVRGGHR